MKHGWLCEGCNWFTILLPWECISCGKEICNHCFDSYGMCKLCCAGKTEAELIEAATKAGYDFE